MPPPPSRRHRHSALHHQPQGQLHPRNNNAEAVAYFQHLYIDIVPLEEREALDREEEADLEFRQVTAARQAGRRSRSRRRVLRRGSPATNTTTTTIAPSCAAPTTAVTAPPSTTAYAPPSSPSPALSDTTSNTWTSILPPLLTHSTSRPSTPSTSSGPSTPPPLATSLPASYPPCRMSIQQQPQQQQQQLVYRTTQSRGSGSTQLYNNRQGEDYRHWHSHSHSHSPVDITSHAAATMSCDTRPSTQTLRAVVKHAIPHATVLDVEPVSPLAFRRTSKVRIQVPSLVDRGEMVERTVMVVLPPGPQWALRSEKWGFGSEFAVLRYLRELEERVGSHHALGNGGGDGGQETVVVHHVGLGGGVSFEDDGDVEREKRIKRRKTEETNSEDDEASSYEDEDTEEGEGDGDSETDSDGVDEVRDMMGFLPRVYYHKPVNGTAGAATAPASQVPCTIMSTIVGGPLSKFYPSSTTNTATTRTTKNTTTTTATPNNSGVGASSHHLTQLGTLLANLASITSPNSCFGPAGPVISGPDPLRLSLGGQGMLYTGGAADWATAFFSLHESVLRDAEDCAIVLPYGRLRGEKERFAGVLGRVKRARLFLGELGGEVVVGQTSGMRGGGEGGSNGDLRLAGISDLSSAFFGDFLMCDVFSSFGDCLGTTGTSATSQPSSQPSSSPPAQSPQSALAQGFFGTTATTAPTLSLDQPETWPQTELVEDLPNALGRMLLYESLRLVVGIVRCGQQRRGYSMGMEMRMRKRLEGVLERLGGVGVVV